MKMRNRLILSIAVASVALAAAADAQRNRDPRHQRTPTASSTPTANAGPIDDQGVHNAVHAAHQSQIVFLRKDVGIGAITEADIVSDFTLGQPMFFRVFTERSAINAIAAANNVNARDLASHAVKYTARFTIDGQIFETSMFPWGNPQDHETWTTWRGQFVNTIGAQRTPGTDVFMEMLSKATADGLLKPGKHSVKMEVIPQSFIQNVAEYKAGVVATGSFNLTVPAGVFQPSNSALCGPTRGGTASAAMEARALSEARRISTNPERTLVRAIGTGESWDIERNEITGIPTERETTVAIIGRGPKYCTVNSHYYYEDYMGGGNFGTSTASISITSTTRYIPCGCLG
jgi:hypothetical protein